MSTTFIKIVTDHGEQDYITSIVEVDNFTTARMMRLLKEIDNFTPYRKSFNGCIVQHTENFPLGEHIKDHLGQLSAFDYYVKNGNVEISTYTHFIENILPKRALPVKHIVSLEILNVSSTKNLIKNTSICHIKEVSV